jgi:hypothetical protein
MESKTISQIQTQPSYGPWKTIIFAGLLAGTLDAVAAIVVYGAAPAGMFRFIASGAFGAGQAFSGGSIMVFWGILFHYLIAFSWTLLFFFTYPVFSFLRKNKYITGSLYGIFVWVVMNRVVLPLSLISQRPFSLNGALVGAAILVVGVSLPIVILTHRYYSRKGTL